jgi:hypothetical protein
MGDSTFILWRVPRGPRSAGEVIAWWEKRRPAYNLFVLAVAIPAGLIYVWLTAWAPPPFIVLVLLFLGANVCYTGGWIVELFVRALTQRNDFRFASVAMKSGLLVSVLAVASPILLTVAYHVITGEPYSPYVNATSKQPNIQGLAGEYLVTHHDWYPEAWTQMPPDSVPSLTLNPDGTFTFRDRVQRPTGVFPSPSQGIESRGMYSGQGTWRAVNTGGRWELEMDFGQSGGYVTRFMLRNNKPPYSVYVILDDPDQWEGVVFELAEQPAP